MSRLLVITGYFLFCMNAIFAQTHAPIAADVYPWDQSSGAATRPLLKGSTPAFANLSVSVHILPIKSAAPAAENITEERLIIVKEGQLTLTQEGKRETLETNSVALLVPGDAQRIENQSEKPVTYYVMAYQARDSTTTRDKTSGSFVRHWHDLAYQPNQKGGRRNVFDTATNQARRFEMHITTLGEGLMSHPPHTHVAAEILLLIEGKAEESIKSINGIWTSARVGDVIFLQSEVPHAIRNVGKAACTYFAFQFE